MKRIRKELIVSSRDKEKINRYLQQEPFCEEECLGENETIAYTVDFGDGIEMDIKLCGVRYQQEQSNKAWAEAVLYEKGCEVAHTDPDDAFFQEWICEHEGFEYAVVVKAYDNISGELGSSSKQFGKIPAIALDSVNNGWLTHDADFGLEDWEETLFFVPSDPDGAYNILDVARHHDDPEFVEILKKISLRLADYESTGLSPNEVLRLTSERNAAAKSKGESYEKENNKIEVLCTAGTLCAEIGGDPNFPEIYTYLRRTDGVEVDVTAVCGDGIVPAGVNPEDFDGQKENDGGLSVYLYKDTSSDCYSERFRISKEQLTIEG